MQEYIHPTAIDPPAQCPRCAAGKFDRPWLSTTEDPNVLACYLCGYQHYLRGVFYENGHPSRVKVGMCDA